MLKSGNYWGKPSENSDDYLVITSKLIDCTDSAVEKTDLSTLWKCLPLSPKLFSLWIGSRAEIWDSEGGSSRSLANPALQPLV